MNEEKKVRRTRRIREMEETAYDKAAKLLIQNNEFKNITDIEDAVKQMLGSTIKKMLEAEFEQHMQTPYYEHDEERDNYRNGYKSKTVNSTAGKRDISHIESKILSMYSRGMSNKDISDTIEEIYGFDMDESLITNVTNKILPIAEEWKNRALEKVYPVVFIDATHFSVRDEGKVSKKAAYVILGIDINGKKDVLSIEIGDAENSKLWLSVLSSLKARGVK
ncbi:transposase, partial [Streptobacillus canis]|uniref:transposase n=1 Tax=Streptobacillus canis TaxID=2678686 RepID=UPI0018CC3CE3